MPTEMPNEFLISAGTIGVVTAIIVEVIKQVFGWKDRKVMIAALITGQLLSLVAWAAGNFELVKELYTVAMSGIMAFASSTGLYKLIQRGQQEARDIIPFVDDEEKQNPPPEPPNVNAQMLAEKLQKRRQNMKGLP